jgi:outer membrane cobalamin receptor
LSSIHHRLSGRTDRCDPTAKRRSCRNSGADGYRLPLSVSTVTAQEIADRDAQTTRDALQYTAGVNTYFREGQFTREYGLIRGFQGLQFLDGLRLNVNNYGIEPYGLERIDVLKGPAATLYGQGSPGGLWDMTNKRPTDKAFSEFLIRANSGSARAFRAQREIVLCGGGLGSPKVLMQSGIGDGAHLSSLGIKVVRELPGVVQN